MARPKLGDSDSKRLQMVITESELKTIEDWQFANRVPSKSEAIRRLVQIGLAFDEKADDLHAAMKAMSADLSARANGMMETSGMPADNDPPWLASYVVEAGTFAQTTFEHLVQLGNIARAMDAKRHFMKLGDHTFESAAAGAIAYEAQMLVEQLQERVEEFERGSTEDDE